MNSCPRIVDSITTRSSPSAPQKRACANGRSAEMPSTTALSGFDASSLNLRSAVAHTPVSTLGKMLSKNGGAHVGTPVTNAHLVCRLPLDIKKLLTRSECE